MGSLSNPASALPAPSGVGVLHGPYTVDHTDIAHDGDTKTLWTPQVGDVLLTLYGDKPSAVNWSNSGVLAVGQLADPGGLLSYISGTQSTGFTGGYPTGWVFTQADPVVAQISGMGGATASEGHVSFYALVARAVAP